jgi:hypothetical protein
VLVNGIALITTAHPLPQITIANRYLLTSYGFHLPVGILLHQQSKFTKTKQ